MVNKNFSIENANVIFRNFEKKWSDVRTHLVDLDTSILHYVKVPENHIVIDFDLKGLDGEKSLKMNLNAAKEWPPTYVETSKSGEGLHLHYIYAGDVSKLKPVYKDGIEVKVFTGLPLKDEGAGTAKALSQALKIAINSVYGLTSAK